MQSGHEADERVILVLQKVWRGGTGSSVRVRFAASRMKVDNAGIALFERSHDRNSIKRNAVFSRADEDHVMFSDLLPGQGVIAFEFDVAAAPLEQAGQ